MVSEKEMSTMGELACSYSVMILEDEGIAITVCILSFKKNIPFPYLSGDSRWYVHGSMLNTPLSDFIYGCGLILLTLYP